MKKENKSKRAAPGNSIPTDSKNVKSYRDFDKYWLPVIILLGIIFWMSSDTFSSQNTFRFIIPILHYLFPGFSPKDLKLIHGLIRKFAHITEYFFLGLLLFRAFRSNSLQIWQLRWSVLAIVWATFFAFSDELHQLFVASRTSSFFDIGLDITGGFISQVAILLMGELFA